MYHRRKIGVVKTSMSEQQRQEDGFHDEDNDVDLNHHQAMAMNINAIDTMDIPEPLGSDNSSSKDWKAQVAAGFTSLKNSPPELYKVYALKFLDSYSYFSFSIIFTLFLSDDFGYSDIEAGTIYGAWGAMITVYGFCTGFLVDNFGVAKVRSLLFLSFSHSLPCFLSSSSLTASSSLFPSSSPRLFFMFS